MFKKKKKQLRFFSVIPEVKDVFPLVPAKEVRREWASRAIQKWKEDREREDFGTTRAGSVTKCPGINKIHRTGWVLRAWQDITVKADFDKNKFEVFTAMPQEDWKSPLVGKYVTFHPAGQFADFVDMKPHTMHTLMKINSPWYADIPEGYQLLCIPIPYPDDNQFTAAIGILESDMGPIPLNAQLFWHNINRVGVIKAGTPLAQYVLVKKEHPEVEVTIGEMTDRDFKRSQHSRAAIQNKFVSSTKERIDHWKEYLKNEKKG